MSRQIILGFVFLSINVYWSCLIQILDELNHELQMQK